MTTSQLRKMQEGREHAQKLRDREARQRVKAWLVWSGQGGRGVMPTVLPGDERFVR